MTADDQHPLLDEIRLIELEAALRSFPPPPSRVLEIGAGSGWQASLLRDAGYEVAAVDVAVDGFGDKHHTVLPIDGRSLPFADNSFDVVFSSNVLEHVKDLRALLSDVDRVLAARGRSVHLMPTRTWRALTMLTFYLGAPERLRARRRSDRGDLDRASPEPGVIPAPGGSDRSLRGRVVERAHGEFRSPVVELLEYGRRRWFDRLREASVEKTSMDAYPAGILYTGYGLLPRLSVPMRRRLARAVGSGCIVYVVSHET